MLESHNKSDSRNFDIRYFPGGKQLPAIVDGYDFIMTIRPIQEREMDSEALAKYFRPKGIQGLVPFFSRINKQLQQANLPRTLREFIEKKTVAGKSMSWKILRQKKSKVLFGSTTR